MTTLKVQRPVVLVVEEDDPTREFLADNLLADGFAVVAACTAESGLVAAQASVPDIAVVSVNGGSGRDFVQAVRGGQADGVERRLPMILLGGDPHEIDTLRALDAGADDHVPKPFSYPVLHARVRALLRRVELDTAPRTAKLTVGPLTFDTLARRCEIDGRLVTLTDKEFRLLRMMIAHPDRVYSKAELMAAMQINPRVGATRTLDSHACRLRGKLGPGWIVNIWGVGYRLTSTAGVVA